MSPGFVCPVAPPILKASCHEPSLLIWLNSLIPERNGAVRPSTIVLPTTAAPRLSPLIPDQRAPSAVLLKLSVEILLLAMTASVLRLSCVILSICARVVTIGFDASAPCLASPVIRPDEASGF